MAERMAEAQERMKDKFKYEMDDWSVGKGIGIGKGKGSADDESSELKIVVLQSLCESDPAALCCRSDRLVETKFRPDGGL